MINGIFTPVVGIKVYENTLYGAVGSLPPLTGPFYGGLLILDLQNPASKQLVDFSPLYDGKLMTPNDVVYSSYANAVFVTDFYSYRIFRYDLSSLAISTILTRGVLCSICSDTLVYDGPNGITSKGTYLLVARSGTIAFGSTPAIVHVPIDNTSAAFVVPIYPVATSSESILDGADGLLFDQDNEILYVTNNGADLIVAIRSHYGVDDWTIGEVVSTYSTRCQYKDPSTSTIISGTYDVVVICTEQFGAGPYSLNRLSTVASNYAAASRYSYPLTLPFMIPESLVYQPSSDTILYTSFGLGQVYSTFNPVVPLTSGYSLTSGTMRTVFQNLPTSSGLLGIQVDPLYDYIVWGAYNKLNGVGGGLYRCNSLTGFCDVTLDLDVATNGLYPAFYNDVSIDPIDGTVYSTDTAGSHKIEATRPHDRTGTRDNTVETVTVASNICIDCSATCDGAGSCGPNGIALIPNGKKKAVSLITGVYSATKASNGFFRVDIQSGIATQLTVIPDTFVDNLDGIRFDDVGEFLFVASFGKDVIAAYYSCDDWKSTMYLAGVFKGACNDGTNTAITYTTSGDLVVTCVDNFGSGPYSTSKITNVRSRLLGSSYSSIYDFCDGDEPFDIEDDNDGEDNDSDDETIVIILIVLAITMGITALIFAVLYYLRGAPSRTRQPTSELTTVQNVVRA